MKHDDEGSALDYALIRRDRDYGSDLHGIATAIVRHLLDAKIKPQLSPINHHTLFLAPYEKTREWGRHLNEDEVVSLLHFVNCGLPLQSRNHQPAVNGKEWDAKLEHELLFHTPSQDLMLALSTKLHLRDKTMGTNLLHVLAAGCEQEYAIYTNRHVGPAMQELIKRGASPNGIYQRETDHPENHQPGETVFHVFLKRATRCALGGLQSQELILAELKVLLGPGRANPCRQQDSSYPIDAVLGNAAFVDNHPDYARDIIELLLEHFPPNFRQAEAPLWLRRVAGYFPITPFYQAFADGAHFHQQVSYQSDFTAAGDHIFLQAIRMVSMRKFLHDQLHAEKSARLYDGILEVLRAQEDMNAPRKSFSRKFVIEVLSLLQPRPFEDFTTAAGYYERGTHMPVHPSYSQCPVELYDGYRQLEQQQAAEVHTCN